MNSEHTLIDISSITYSEIFFLDDMSSYALLLNPITYRNMTSFDKQADNLSAEIPQR